MINFLKSLPDGISLSYMIFKLLDKNSVENHHYGYNFFTSTKELLIKDQHANFRPPTINYISFTREKGAWDARHIVIQNKLNTQQVALIIDERNFGIQERELIDEFYTQIEDSFKENDTTKLILTMGKDPFKVSEWLLKTINEENYNSLKEVLFNNSDLWK